MVARWQVFGLERHDEGLFALAARKVEVLQLLKEVLVPRERPAQHLAATERLQGAGLLDEHALIGDQLDLQLFGGKRQEDVELVLLAGVAGQRSRDGVDRGRTEVEGAGPVAASAVVDLDLELAGNAWAFIADLHGHRQPAADLGQAVETDANG